MNSNLAKMPPSEINGPLFLNILDFGAKGDGSSDDSQVFQRSVDYLSQAQLTNQGIATIFIPPTPRGYYFNNSLVLDKPNMQMVGGGAGALITCNTGCPAIYLGVKRRAQTPELFPDGFGVYDTSYCQGTAQRYGLRLAEYQVQFQSNAFQYGTTTIPGHYDYWETTSQLTVEFFIDFTNSQGNGSLGLGTWQGANPWNLGINGNSTCIFTFNTSDSDASAVRQLQFATTGFTGPLRGVIQLNLDTATYSVLLNDKSVPVTYSDWSTQANPPYYGKPWGPGLKFAANDSVPFLINAGGALDFTLYGLRISNTIRYADPGSGNTLAQIPQDSARYFGADANTICYLTFDQQYNKTQFVSFASPGVYGNTIKVHRDDMSETGNGSFTGNINLKNLQINGSMYAAQTVSVADVINPQFIDLNITGLTPLGTYNIAASYTWTMKNCILGGTDCCFAPWQAIINAENIQFTLGGRDIIRSVSCNSTWNNVLVTGVSTDTVFKFLSGGYGASTTMENVIIDLEGYVLRTAVLVQENCSYNPGTTLTLKNFFIGSVGNCPCFILRDMDKIGTGTGVGKAWVDMQNVSVWGNYSTFLQTDGPLWASSNINGYFLSDSATSPLHTHITKFGPVSNVKFTNIDYQVVTKDINSNIIPTSQSTNGKIDKNDTIFNKFSSIIKRSFKTIGNPHLFKEQY